MNRLCLKNGFTLVETLVSITLLGIILAAVVPALLSNTALNRDSDYRTKGYQAVKRVIDEYRTVDLSDPLISVDNIKDITISGTPFKVSTDFCSIPSYCVSNAKQFVVTAKIGQKIYATIETVFTTVNTNYGDN